VTQLTNYQPLVPPHTNCQLSNHQLLTVQPPTANR
jgi:hypothetical protein